MAVSSNSKLISYLLLSTFLFIQMSHVIATDVKDKTEDAGQKITLADVLSGTYNLYAEFNGTWISDDEFHYFDVNRNLLVHNVTSGAVKELISSATFAQVELENESMELTLSSDRKYALIGYNKLWLYRNSFQAKYYLHQIGSKVFERLVPQEGEKTEDDGMIQFVQWSPTNNALAFVYQNDVYYRASADSKAPVVRLTRTGAPDIFNGICDWVYEEEMFGTFKALWFSTDGSKLAFATFNDSKVQRIRYSLYGQEQLQYPYITSFPYPKAGTQNPIATMSIADLTTSSGPFKVTENLKLTAIPELAHYIGTAVWATSTHLIIVTLNRVQNESQIIRCDAVEGCKTIFKIEEPFGWIDVNTPKVSKDGRKLVMIKSVQQKDLLSYRHIVKVDITKTFPDADVQLVPITSGSFSVDSIEGWDEDNERIFFMATGYNISTAQASPSESHLYVVEHVLTEMASESYPKLSCLSCAVKKDTNEYNGFNGIAFSKNFHNFAQTSSGPWTAPQITIRNLENVKEPLELWENNSELQNKIDVLSLPIIQDYEISIPNSQFKLKARLWLPPDYNQAKKYPLLVDVYGGPGSQQITEQFKIDWGTALASSKNVIYASIDGRGSGRQSNDLMFQIHRQLGTVEIQDQIEGTKWLIDHVKIIDENQTAIWGWSYGGFATAMVLATDMDKVFKCGISVAPVTNWALYDTIYTERYMGLPKDNVAAYNSSDVTRHVENFRNKKFYLIHGSSDDNVHFQQTMKLARALEDQDILFRQQIYPDEDHYLQNVRPHLYHSMENFLFEECFS